MLIWIWKEKSATLSFCLLTFKLTAFFFSLPSSVSWCLSPAKKNSHSHTEFRELFCHFHHHCTLLFIPMKATSHLASSAHRNFDTRLLSRENSEVACCRRFRFSLINNVWLRLSIFSEVFFGEATERDTNFLSQGHEGVFIFLGLRS